MTRRRATGEDEADPAMDVRKARDATVAVPLAGALLLLPPVAEIFAVEGTILGIPVLVGYLFLVWLGLVILAWRAGRRILETESASEGGLAPARGAARGTGRAGAGAR